MKILIISSFFPPSHTAGTEKRSFGYAQGLRELGHEVQVICAGDWDTGEQYWNGFSDETYDKIPVRRIHVNWALAPDPNRYLYNNPFIEKKGKEWISEWNPDLVHITSCLTLSASIIQAVKNRGLPVILTLTDFWFICPKISLVRGDGTLCDGRTTSWDCLKCLMWISKVYKDLKSIMPEEATATILKWVSRHPKISRVRGLRGMAFDMDDRKTYLTKMIQSVDCLTAPSEFLGNIFNACGVSKPIRVIRSGHDLTWLETMPPKKTANLVRIGFIGQITQVKGLHILLSSFISASLMGKAQLSLFGNQNKDPEYTTQLEMLSMGQNGTIKFKGEFPHDQLGEVFSQIDVLVVPSLWHENNPRVIQEAFACKTPVIGSNVGGISEFVTHNFNGLLFERGNVEDLKNQLQRVVLTPGLLDQLRGGIMPVKSIHEEIIEIETIYREILN